MLLSATNVLVRVLLAPSCAACEQLLATPLDGPVCASCWRAVPRLSPPCCVRCGDALASWRPVDPLCARCRRRESPLSVARSAGRYDGSLRAIVHAFKYGGRRALAAPLGRLVADAGLDLLAGADAVVPVPLHPRRAWRRGFNQADDLAAQLGPPVWRVLRRRRSSVPQAGLPLARRHANVRDAFAPAFLHALGSTTRLRNRSVVLVDDVMTSGATLEACARVLLAQGARRVSALTVARAVAGRPSRPPPPPRPSGARRR